VRERARKKNAQVISKILKHFKDRWLSSHFILGLKQQKMLINCARIMYI